MSKVRVKLVKSIIGCPERQKATVKALGLHRMNSTVEVEANPQMLGMIRKVSHLVSVEEL
ncbi:MAG: 50S ribosomal protein L30 [Bacteroidales bacterium]|jgi:large subunit ribosomal protein L30|nr:50S ribosomal protein L30 [Bacteroidales bacterium]MCR5713670.1 50S ribosomal protein L30 [Bacteroidales bacterium]